LNVGIESCEKIVIHHKTGLAFMACGNGTFRARVFYPPINKNVSALPKVIRETPYVYNINVCILKL
jgi:arylesterase/paraoxonase